MAAMDFPSSPTNGQVYGNYVYSTSKGAWQARPVTSEVAVISPTAPSNPKAGDIWYNSDDGCTYVYYYDGDSYQWVASRNDATFSSTLGPRVDALEQGAVNYIINGAFEINQRNFSSTTTSQAFTFDRWIADYSGGTTTYSSQAFTPGAAPVAGYEGTTFIRVAATSQTSTGYTALVQKIEDVRTTAGKYVTVSFWAKAASAANIAISLDQGFGSGGSTAVINAGAIKALSTSWQRYTWTIQMPSLTGKTIGANSLNQFYIFTSVGSSVSALGYPALGVQNATVDIWGVQIQAGSVATAFRRNANSIQGELAACQRYYYRVTGASGVQLGSGIAFSGTGGFFNVPYAVTMRATVSSIDTNGTFSYGNGVIAANFSSCTLESGTQGTRSAFLRLDGSSGMTTGMPYRLDGSSTAYIGFNAEL